MGQVDVGDDKVGQEVAGLRQYVAAIPQGQDFMPVRAQEVAKKFEIEFVVLDNEHALCHQSPAFPKIIPEASVEPPQPVSLIMRPDTPNGKPDSAPDAMTLALLALGWTLGDAARADRLLALTGLDADALRDGIDNRVVLAALLAFLADHEPDLMACADAIGTTPTALIAAQEALSR